MRECWAQAYFEKEGYFGRKLIFGEKTYFGKYLILEQRTTDGKKEACKKRRKRTCKRKSNMACRQESLTMIGLGFLINIVMTISL
jgi:hypothetical protein